MKKNRLFFMFAALFVAAAVMFSCQKEEVLNVDVQLKSGVVALDTDCDCINEVIPVVLQTTSSNTGVKANVTVWNDNDNFYIKVEPESGTMDKVELSYPISYKTTNNDKCNSTGIDYNHESENLVPVATYTFTFPLESDWACTDAEFALIAKGLVGGNVSLDGPLYDREFTYTKTDKGTQVTATKECEVPGAISYTLYEICVGCETEMDGATECDEFVINGETYTHKAVFTYTPEIDGYVNIQGGLAAKWTSYYAVFDGDVFTQTANTKSNAAVYSYAGDVVACQTYTITVYWTTTNTDAEIIDEWTAELSEYVDEEKVLFNIFAVDPMECDDSKVGYLVPAE